MIRIKHEQFLGLEFQRGGLNQTWSHLRFLKGDFKLNLKPFLIFEDGSLNQIRNPLRFETGD